MRYGIVRCDYRAISVSPTIHSCSLGPLLSRLTTTTAILSLLASLSFASAGLPALQVPKGFGVNIHFRGNPHDLDLIRDAGFKLIRMDLTWAAIERRKGHYEFGEAGYDALTDGCCQRGIRILYILDYSNRVYESDRSVRTEKGRRAFAAFAEAAASRFSGKAILWEIWNEPNLRHFWSPQPSVDDYCKLVEETARGIRNADPSGLVVAPATSGMPLKWLGSCFKKGLLQHVDALSVHPYRSKPPETVIQDYAKLRRLVRRYAPTGKSIPIISGEWGYSLINWDKSRLSEQQQAQYLVRMLLLNLYQRIPISIWYDWKDDGINPSEREHHFGTVMYDLKPKTAYLAAESLSSALNGYHIEQRLALGSENDFALELSKGKNKAIAFWTADQPHEVTLPVQPNEASLVDMLGNKRPVSWKTDTLKLKISQGPQYLLMEGKVK